MIQNVFQSPVYYPVEEEVLKNINRPEKREFLSLPFSPSFSRRAFLVPRNKLFPRPRYHLSG